MAALALHAHSQPLSEAMPADSSRYHRTVLFLQNSSADLQTVFAATALSELVEVYMAEADLARKQAALQKGNRKLAGWSYAVDQYASQLLLLLEDIQLGIPMALLISKEESVTVTVGGRAVMLNHPRADQQTAFEQRVLLGFCSRENCKQITVSATSEQPIPVSASRVSPQWIFTDDGTVCSHGAIQVRYGSVRKLGQYRSTCEQFLQELMALTDEIAWQQRHGVVIDWDVLVIRATPGRPEHLVQLNSAGDSILTGLPLIYASPNLLVHIKPWLQQRFSGEKSAALQLDAAQYGWLQSPE